jgi:hypothetical protein
MIIYLGVWNRAAQLAHYIGDEYLSGSRAQANFSSDVHRRSMQITAQLAEHLAGVHAHTESQRMFRIARGVLSELALNR